MDMTTTQTTQSKQRIHPSQETESLAIRIVKQHKEIPSLLPAWNRLAQRANSHICSTPEWILAWWDCFGRNEQRSIYLVSIWHRERLVALAPMYLGWSEWFGRTIQVRLQMIGSGGSPDEQTGYLDDYGISDFLDILVDPEYLEAAADRLITFFRENRAGADLIQFHQAREDSFVHTALLPRLRSNPGSTEAVRTDICPYIAIRSDSALPDYIKELKSNARRRMRQTLKAQDKKGIYRIRAVAPEELERAVETIMDMHQERWNRLGFPGVFHDPRFVRFFRRLVEETHRNGQLWFHEAIDEEGVCASRMLIRYNRRFYDYISCFDDKRPSSKYRPGIGLLLQVVKESLEDDVETVELLRGEEGYKYDFTDQSVSNWKLTYRPESRPSRPRGLTGLIDGLARIRKITSTESRLLRVQSGQNGKWGALPGYVAFRFESVKRRLTDR